MIWYLKAAEPIFQVLRALLFASPFGPLLETHRDLLKPDVIWNIEKGLALTADEIGRAERSSKLNFLICLGRLTERLLFHIMASVAAWIMLIIRKKWNTFFYQAKSGKQLTPLWAGIPNGFRNRQCFRALCVVGSRPWKGRATLRERMEETH